MMFLRAKNSHEKAPLGLRTVAAFEFVKGLLFLLFALGALLLVHRDAAEEIDKILRALHLDPAWHYTHLLVEKVSNVTDAQWGLLSILALFMGIVRLTEAFGLWYGLHWAEWFAVITASVYIPLEVRHFIRKPSVAGAVVFGVNVAIVIYLARILAANRRKKLAAKLAAKASANPP